MKNGLRCCCSKRLIYPGIASSIAGETLQMMNHLTCITPSPRVPVFPAGTKLIINNGEEPGVAPGPTEHVPLYAGHNAQSFVPGGTYIRIVDAEDTIVHQRPFLRDSRYTTQDVHLIRNPDQTRLLFFIKQNGLDYSELSRGIYRIAFTFLRDTGDPKTVLKRFGFSDAETGHIEFSIPTFLP